MLKSLFEHVFLARRLLDIQDTLLPDVSHASDARLLLATRQLRDQGKHSHILLGVLADGPIQHQQALNSCVSSLKESLAPLLATGTLQLGGFIDTRAQAFISACRQLEVGHILAVHITAQSAAIILRESESRVFFDAFEASARCADVSAATAALQWNFSGSSVHLPLSVFDNADFSKISSHSCTMPVMK